MVYIGIDLGTTYSCVAIFDNGRPITLFNDDGKHTVPSIVAYGEEEILVGNPALIYNTDLSNILYDSKRLIGWGIVHDLPLAEDRQLWTFNVDTRNKIAGYILHKGTPREKFVTPEEVSAEILKKLKLTAETYLGQEVRDVVVTIPAFFQAEQIAATKRAVELAGLNLRCLLEEPSAAAIAYNKKRKLDDSSILIFDFGGGTLDISILDIKNGNLSVKAVSGDAHLGGQDLDSKIMRYVIDTFAKSFNFDICDRPRLIKRLRTECRKAKESLSSVNGPINIHMDIKDELEVNVELTRERFQELCHENFQRTIYYVLRAISSAGLKVTQIDHVILVGGSTKIPLVQKLLGERFGEGKLKFDINPNEAVAHGAAILAHTLQKYESMPLINLTLNETASNVPNSFEMEILARKLKDHEILFYLNTNESGGTEGTVRIFNSQNCTVEKFMKLCSDQWAYEAAIASDKIFYVCFIQNIFEIIDLKDRQKMKGPDLLEWRKWASIAYFKEKLYYICGRNSHIGNYREDVHNCSNRVDVLINGNWQKGPKFPIQVTCAKHIICDGKLYVIDDAFSRKIFRLSNDEELWQEVGEIREKRSYTGITSLNGKIYLTGGCDK
ncbi:hypothetical protein WR25_19419 isoform A [Diploscapter pachys]|uniref:Uncharacterized protein n=1 Tax=Diploscapter pachys TaxID=2018661 RepID=A0A2A2J3T5_9BILA|nr:hypothetical protein WR25_19419 isoform A [Diploscapter pachys]